jgi:hypothetical protein
VALGVLACGTLPAVPPGRAARVPLDLARPSDNLLGYVKTRGALGEKEVVFYWKGVIYSYDQEAGLPLRRSNKLLLRLEGVDVARFVKAEDGYKMLSRAAVVYEDPATGKILECWRNPLHGKHVSVVHVWNDPINVPLPESRWSPMPYSEAGDRVVFSTDMLLAYPSPLPVASYPEYSGSDLYQSVELFNFFTSRAALEQPGQESAPVEVSWTRVGPYLPWMQMGSEPGALIYQAHGRKLLGGWEELPEHLREYVQKHHPQFQHAPTEWPAGQPNTTTWKAFKWLVDGGQYTPGCREP